MYIVGVFLMFVF